MDNWKVILDDGTELGESQAGYWDNVPNTGIKQVTFVLLTGSKLVFEKFTSICIARLGVGMVDGTQVHTGYRITEIKDSVYNDFMITKEGVKRNTTKIEELTIPMQCFRKGA